MSCQHPREMPVTLSVLHVFALRYRPKIVNSIVGRVAIDVVNDFWRPNTMHIKPCKAVSQIRPPVDHKLEVAARLGAAQFFPEARSEPAIEFPCSRIVVDDFTEFFDGQARYVA